MRTVNVVAAVMQKEGKFLIAQRGAGKYPYLENKWEFPGGKIEEGETAAEALTREMKEEFDIEAEAGALISESTYEYPDFIVNLFGYGATHVSGEFKLNVHKSIRWITVDELDQYEFVPAEAPILEKIKVI